VIESKHELYEFMDAHLIHSIGKKKDEIQIVL